MSSEIKFKNYFSKRKTVTSHILNPSPSSHKVTTVQPLPHPMILTLFMDDVIIQRIYFSQVAQICMSYTYIMEVWRDGVVDVVW